MYKPLGAIILILFANFGLSAQDAHFTQYYQVPGYTNPSLTGNFNGLYKVGVNYRDQWRAAIKQPYSTFTASGESKFYLGGNKQDLFALGILFYSDKISNFNLNSSQISLAGSFHKLLDKRKKRYIGLGYQVGIMQKNLNYENLTFGDQFNAIDGYTLLTKELLPGNNIGVFDTGFGLDYSQTSLENRQLNLGIAMFHINQPNISFFKNDVQLLNDSLNIDAKIDRKLLFHISYAIPSSEEMTIEPRFMFTTQDKHREMLISNLFKYKQLSTEGRTFYFGPAIRLSNTLDNIGLESLIGIVGFEYKGLNIGLSYDHNVKDLFNDRLGFGSIEVSINYFGQYENSDAFCPTF